jgi:hypothetical protein
MTDAQTNEENNAVNYATQVGNQQTRDTNAATAYGTAASQAANLASNNNQFNVTQANQMTASRLGATGTLAGLYGTENYNNQQNSLGKDAVKAVGGTISGESAGAPAPQTKSTKAQKAVAKKAATTTNKKKK